MRVSGNPLVITITAIPGGKSVLEINIDLKECFCYPCGEAMCTNIVLFSMKDGLSKTSRPIFSFWKYLLLGRTITRSVHILFSFLMRKNLILNQAGTCLGNPLPLPRFPFVWKRDMSRRRLRAHPTPLFKSTANAENSRTNHSLFNQIRFRMDLMPHAFLQILIDPEPGRIEEKELGTAGGRTNRPELTMITLKPRLIKRILHRL